MPEDPDARRQAARARGAAVLADLMAQSGVSSAAELARRSQLAGATFSDQTVSNLLAAQVNARDSTVLKFITACLHDQDSNPRLAAERATAAYWKARYDDALGRAGDPTAGLVRIGQAPPVPAVFVGRPDVVTLAATVEAGKSVVLAPTGQDKAGPIEPDRRAGAQREDVRPGATRPPLEERSRVLSGMGGAGKSQLAAQYARQVWRDPSLDLLVWVSARTVDSIISAYAQAAGQLMGVDTGRPEQAAQRLLTWLSTTSRSWLIVLDDVQLPNEVQRWWPEPTESGQVIVTTRYRGEGLYKAGRHVVEVGVYTSEQAIGYLQRRLAGARHLFDDAESEVVSKQALAGLADDLGRLPLALTHAAAYLLQEDMSVQEYRSLLADYRTQLKTVFPHRDELPEGDLVTVATTWQISMDLANRLAPGGVVVAVMLLAALLDPDGIPRDVFATNAVTTYLQDVLGREVAKRDVRTATQVLHRLSLLTVDRETPQRAVQVHALVQRATRESHSHNPDSPDAVAARVAADALLEIWPEVERDTVLAAALRSNTRVLHAVAERALWKPNGHRLLARAGNSLGEAGMAADAIAYFQHLHDLAKTYLGSEHRETLAARADLASYRRETGDLVGAAAAYAELVDDCLRVWGPAHPDTLVARANLATCCGDAGDPIGAAAAYADLVDDFARVMGPNHVRTLNAKGLLAHWRGETGDLVGSASLLAEVLEDRVRVLGADHPSTLAARANLASCRGEAGDPVGAEAEFAELLKDRVRVLGPDHPDTFATRSNVAYWRGEAGDSVGAVNEYAEIVEDYVRVVGPDHPDTLTARANVAHRRAMAGDPVGAAVEFVKIIEDSVRLLGRDHPSTLIARVNLAGCCRLAGDPAGAADMFVDLLEDFNRVLGPGHPRTLIARAELARCYGPAGNPAGAAADFAELRDDCLRVLGASHPQSTRAEEEYLHWKRQAFGDSS